MGLADEFPGDGAAAAHDEKTAHGSIFEHLNLNAIFKRTSNLTSPVGITEALYELVSRGRSGIGVGFAIVRRRLFY